MSTKLRLGDVMTRVDVGSLAGSGSHRIESRREMLPIVRVRVGAKGN
jgi:hypothetical protein